MKLTGLVSSLCLILAAAACGDDSTGTGGAGGASSSSSDASSSASTGGSTPTSSSVSATSTASSTSSGDGGQTGSGGDTSSGGAGGDTGSGGSGGAGGDDGSGGSGGGSSVEIENVSQTPGTLSHDGVLAWVGDVVVAAWAEPDSDVVFDQDIASRTSEDGAWSALAALTSDVEVQHAFPSIATDGTLAHLAWNGYPDGGNDIFHASWSGEWSARENLTLPFEDADSRSDIAPSVVALASGEVAVAYLSAPTDEDGAIVGPTEVRVLEVGGDAPVSVVAMDDDSDCSSARAIEVAGTLHVFAACGPLGASSIWHAERNAGAWSEPEPLTTAGDDDEVVVAASPDGVDIAFRRYATCADGSTCIVFARFADSDLGDEIEIESEADAFSPAIGVDADGRPLVAFHAFDDGGYGDIYFARGDADGSAFDATLNLTPGTPDSDEWFPSVVHAGADGTVHVVFEAIIDGSDPLDEEIFLASFVP